MPIRKILVVLFVLVVGVLPVQAQSGATVYVPEEATVRSGPGTVYDRLGQLTAEQTAPAVARSIHSDWIQIEYSVSPTGRGWVYAPFVELRGAALESLPVVEAPPTQALDPTPEGETNPFIEVPTLAPQLPTFTPAQPAEIKQYTETELPAAPFPPIMLVFAFLAVCVFGIVMAVIRRNA